MLVVGGDVDGLSLSGHASSDQPICQSIVTNLNKPNRDGNSAGVTAGIRVTAINRCNKLSKPTS
jgi:hypothetical protein